MIARTYGDPTAPALVFLHGFMGNAADWDNIAPSVASQHYCICIDLPGHGSNTQLEITQSINFETIASDLKASLASIDVTNATFVGYSLGGRVALFMARQYPALVSNLILESANPGITAQDQREKRVAVDQQRAAEIAADLPAFLARWYQLPFFQTMDQTQSDVQAMLQRRHQNDPRWLSKLIVELSPGQMDNLWPTLARLDCPLHYIAGERDAKYLAIADQVMAQGNNVTCIVIESAGHNTHLEQRERFIQALDTIL